MCFSFFFFHSFIYFARVKIGMDKKKKKVGKRSWKDIFATGGFEIGFLVDVRVLCV